MKAAIITGCVVLSLLITAPRAHAELPQCKDVSAGTPCQREPTREELQAMLNSPSRVYAERDYMIDCHSYKWKERHFHLKRGSACVFRNCRANPPEICAEGNWGRVPRKLLREQLRDLGRVPRWENVTTDPKPWEKKESGVR